MHTNINRKYYFINKLETNNIEKLDKKTNVIYRNYNSKTLNIELILKLKRYCQKKRIKFYLANNIKLAMRLDLDGVYLPSFNKCTQHLSYSFKRKFSLIGSAHNIKEIKIKEMQSVDKIFISSLFKKNKNYLGMNKFKLISNLTQKRVVALGGISKKNINKLKLIKNPEFAGISFFEQKKGP